MKIKQEKRKDSHEIRINKREIRGWMPEGFEDSGGTREKGNEEKSGGDVKLGRLCEN